MANTGHEPTDKSRMLNIIYFIDSNPTRSFRIPFSVATAALALLVALGVWGVGSVVLVGYTLEGQRRLASDLQESLGAIFEYQSTYDGVFEEAYPSVTVDQPTAPAPEPAVEAQSIARGPLEVEGAAEGFGVAVENPVVRRKGSALVVDLAIRNTRSGEKSEGLTWAAARFGRGEEKAEAVSPPELQSALPGDVDAVTRLAKRYSIRHYKNQNFTFEVPPGQTYLEGILVHLRDVSGRQHSSFVRLGVEIAELPAVTIARKPKPAAE